MTSRLWRFALVGASPCVIRCWGTRQQRGVRPHGLHSHNIMYVGAARAYGIKVTLMTWELGKLPYKNPHETLSEPVWGL